MIRTLLSSVAALGLLVTAGLWIAARLVGPQSPPGVREDRLGPCPPSPNCVSSQADPRDTVHYVEPLPFTGTEASTRQRLLEVLNALPRVRVVEARAGYVRAEARSRLFGFVDDLEFLFDESAGHVHVRSAARLGYGDLGVNRARVERIRAALERLTPRSQRGAAAGS